MFKSCFISHGRAEIMNQPGGIAGTFYYFTFFNFSFILIVLFILLNSSRPICVFILSSRNGILVKNK